MRSERKTLLWLIIGNFIYAAMVSIVGAFFFSNKISFALGVFWGSIGASIYAVHLYNSLQKSLDMDEEAAAKRESGQALIRMLIMIVVVVAGLVMREWLHPCGVIVGVFAIKVSAYLQPFFIHQSEKNA